jgi:hypothetical protein
LAGAEERAPEAADSFADGLWPALPDAEEASFLAAGFEEDDFAARAGDTAPRVDAADAAYAFMLDTSFLILRIPQSGALGTRIRALSPGQRADPRDRLLGKSGLPATPVRAAGFTHLYSNTYTTK